MIIKTKFDIGDQVWTLLDQFVPEPLFECPVCHGSGVNPHTSGICDVEFDNHRYKCRNGFIHHIHRMFFPVPFVISRINIYADDCNRVFYHTNNVEAFFEELTEDTIFATFEEAQAECDRRNNGN